MDYLLALNVVNIILLCYIIYTIKTKDTQQPSKGGFTCLYYYRDTCGYCVKFKPEFDKFSTQIKNKMGVKEIDTTKSENRDKIEFAATTFGFRGTPFVVFINEDRKEFHVYKGPRTSEDLYKFAQQFI